MADYAHPEVLVDTTWVAENKDKPGIRLVEVDVDITAYDEGHIPGAVGWSWKDDLCDTVERDILAKEDFEELMASSGISNDTTVVLYGDQNNWFAAWAFWQLKMHGHEDVRIMDGGRKKWIAEGREVTTERPAVERASYSAQAPDESIRAFMPEVKEAMKRGSAAMIDVRSPQEYSGEKLAPEGLPETCQRGGHVPGAVNVPWARAVNDDGTFKSPEELKEIYENQGVTPDKPVIAYCRIGERSSHTWFVLRYLLGYDNVKNYDGSWTEWGNLVGVPVARGQSPEGDVRGKHV